MAAGYSQIFTLAQIFNNKELKDLIPLVNYKETQDDEGKIHRTTKMKSVSRLVYEKSISAARPYYKPLIHHKMGNSISISGTLIGELDGPVEAIYQTLLGSVGMLEMTVNNADIIRSALKEGERGHNAPKLYLREKTMAQIKALDKKGIERFMQDVMENIFYGDFPETQKKFAVSNIRVGNMFTYAQNRGIWQIKVGAYENKSYNR